MKTRRFLAPIVEASVRALVEPLEDRRLMSVVTTPLSPLTSTAEIFADNNGTTLYWADGADVVRQFAVADIPAIEAADAAGVSALYKDSTGTIFGVGSTGDGSIFKIAPGTTTIVPLIEFDGGNGSIPKDIVFGPDGTIYGTTEFGGANDKGTLFRFNPADPSSFVTLAEFSGTNGRSPNSGLFLDDSGNVFGTAEFGGVNDDGTIFKFDAATATLTSVVNFEGAVAGRRPTSLTAGPDGLLYGATAFGSTSGNGTIFSFNPSNNAFQTVTEMNDDTQGPEVALTIDAAGNIFGVSREGGTSGNNDNGAAFKFDRTAGQLTTLQLFNLNTPVGRYPNSKLFVDASGDLIGRGSQTIFKIAGSGFIEDADLPILADTSISAIATFDGTNGSGPNGGLVTDAAGNRYGTTADGGTSQQGNLFKIDAGTGAVTSLFSFSGTDGTSPSGNLVADSAGNIYGVTILGGANDLGTVFKFDPATSTMTTLASFTGTNGSLPFSGLTIDGAGNLFGTTIEGGANGAGTVFKIAAGTSTIVTLDSFDGTNGSTPYGGVILDSAGNLFGASRFGGASNDGAIYKIAAGTTTITLLESFDGDDGNSTTGSEPRAKLLLLANGDLVGTTSLGGTTDDGTVFRYTPISDTLTTVVSFDGSNGDFPTSALIADAAGNLYGATSTGGVNDNGVVFRITNGATAIVASIAGAQGRGPRGDLTVDADGTIIGAANAGGTNDNGTIFKLSNAGFIQGTSDATLPSTAIAGQKIKGKIAIAFPNPSTTAAFNNTVAINLLASRDQGLNPSDSQILTTTKKLKIKPGGTATIKLPIKSLPEGLDTDTYFVLAQVTPTGGTTRTTVTDAFTAVTAATRNLAGTATGPAKLTGGKSAKLVLSITNSGNTPISQPVEFTINAVPVGGGSTVAIASQTKTFKITAGKTKKITASFGVPPNLAAGSYNMQVNLDSNNGLVESNEQDNTLLSTTVSVAS